MKPVSFYLEWFQRYVVLKNYNFLVGHHVHVTGMFHEWGYFLTLSVGLVVDTHTHMDHCKQLLCVTSAVIRDCHGGHI